MLVTKLRLSQAECRLNRVRHAWGASAVRIDVQHHASMTWQKAAASLPGGNCIEVSPLAEGVALRDSKAPQDGALTYSKAEFAAFVDGCRRGEFDHLVR